MIVFSARALSCKILLDKNIIKSISGIALSDMIGCGTNLSRKQAKDFRYRATNSNSD